MNDRRPIPIMRHIGLTSALALFAVGLFLSVAAVNLHIGALPLRALCIVFSLALAGISAYDLLVEAIAGARKALFVIGFCMLVGLIVSLLNRADTNELIRQIAEVHLQAAAGLILAMMLAAHFRINPLCRLFLCVWGLSAAVAIAQLAGIDLAWQARAFSGDLMADPAITAAFYEEKKRALGLSFTPVHLGSQTCLAFAALFAYRVHNTDGTALKQADLPLILGLMLMMLVCVASGNRSPLLGFAAFTAAYFIIVAPRIVVILLPVISIVMVAGLPLFEMLGETGLRVASTKDGSALGREALALFGLRLFVEQPFGYGLLFDSTQYANAHLHFTANLQNPNVIRHFSLHNYYLQMLTKYGILLIIIIPQIIPRDRAALFGWLGFLPYIVHIAFHNEGPLTSDFMFWFVIPLFYPLVSQLRQNGRKETGRYSGIGVGNNAIATSAKTVAGAVLP
ncbi:O-antigen ligase family protein [Parasphingorhabdus halotolerans]|uniref:O-antigen ligase family protein n=1 Tax=Parasphingorhabdus halotolerans TaxID=2725558 RepID=A0A6H2DPV1_9SPHN|nr:O-antigen ligase family protein [Parasphingorhabdus halotolerans]QJB69696.1 O-antigen ligase family protein [Parasphingorhabdus halotolerans]